MDHKIAITVAGFLAALMLGIIVDQVRDLDKRVVRLELWQAAALAIQHDHPGRNVENPTDPERPQ